MPSCLLLLNSSAAHLPAHRRSQPGGSRGGLLRWFHQHLLGGVQGEEGAASGRFVGSVGRAACLWDRSHCMARCRVAVQMFESSCTSECCSQPSYPEPRPALTNWPVTADLAIHPPRGAGGQARAGRHAHGQAAAARVAAGHARHPATCSPGTAAAGPDDGHQAGGWASWGGRLRGSWCDRACVVVDHTSGCSSKNVLC